MSNVPLAPDWMLTSDHPLAHDGVPVLVRRYAESTPYGPADFLDLPPSHVGGRTAAHLVWCMAQRFEGEERENVKRFLRQWPDGPQLD